MRNNLAVLLLGFAGMALGQGISPGGGGGGGGTGTVTSITTTAPIAGGPITTTGAISCPTCVTSSSSLGNFGAVVGAGSQAAQTSSQLVVSNLGTPGTETWTLTNTGLGTTPVGGFTLTNTTAAAVGTQQISSPMVWSGRGWATAGSSQSVAFRAYTLPVQGAANPTGQWNLDANINAAGYSNVVNFASTGTAVNSVIPVISFGGSTAGYGIGYSGVNSIDFYGNGGSIFDVTSAGLKTLNAGAIGWTSGAADAAYQTRLTSPAAGTVQHGAADAAAPVAQAIRFQSVVAGTSNTNGADATIKASAGTGTGIGGSLIFQVAPAGSTGTAQNALATALTIDSTKLATFTGTVKSAAYQSSDGSAGVTGATCTAWKNGLCTSL